MIDLHCHILPGVDDGARTMEEAVAMGRKAAADGCRALVATPHQRKGDWWNGDRKRLSDLARELQQLLGQELKVYLGGEVHAEPGLLSAVELLPGGEILPLASSHYLLIELGAGETEDEGADLINEIRVLGWRPVVAHPEFIPWLAGDVAAAARLVSLGAALQVTGMSVTGGFGRAPQRSAWTLLDAALVHFVASDSHDLLRRPPGLSTAFSLVADRWGAAAAEALFDSNPRAVVENRPLPTLP